MRLPFVSRKKYEELAASDWAAKQRAAKAETALRIAFNVSVEDVLDADVKEIRVRVSHKVLKYFQGDPRDVMRREAHIALDRLIDNR